jgi:hypothetical protein
MFVIPFLTDLAQNELILDQFISRVLTLINIDYYMAFFISYPLSALDHDISPRADRLKWWYMKFPENCVYKHGGFNCLIKYLHRKLLTTNFSLMILKVLKITWHFSYQTLYQPTMRVNKNQLWIYRLLHGIFHIILYKHGGFNCFIKYLHRKLLTTNFSLMILKVLKKRAFVGFV